MEKARERERGKACSRARQRILNKKKNSLSRAGVTASHSNFLLRSVSLLHILSKFCGAFLDSGQERRERKLVPSLSLVLSLPLARSQTRARERERARARERAHQLAGERAQVRERARVFRERESSEDERWGAGVETQKNVRGEIGGWGRVPFNEIS